LCPPILRRFVHTNPPLTLGIRRRILVYGYSEGHSKMPQKHSTPLALAVLVFLFERPMHPYEMAATLRERHKEESIKLRYGSLYTVIGLLESSGRIRPKETTRDGKRPERTVYELTPAGEEEMREWMREILRTPVKEFPQFEAGLSLLPAVPLEEAAGFLDARIDLLNKEIEKVNAGFVRPRQ